MHYDHNKKFGLLKFHSGYGTFYFDSPKGYSRKIINAQTDNNSLLVSKRAVNHSCLVLSVPRCKCTLKAALQTRYVRAVGPQCTNKRQLLFRSSSSVVSIEDNLELWQNKFLLCGLNYNIYK